MRLGQTLAVCLFFKVKIAFATVDQALIAI